MSTLKRLQDWYRIHCNNDWEHDERIKIINLDNPGWRVEIDISSTILEGKKYIPQKSGNPEQRENDWIDCSINDNIFVGIGSYNMLEKIISEFLQWAEKNTDTSEWNREVEDLIGEIEECRRLSKEDAIGKMRKLYRKIEDDIPSEHPQKEYLLHLFPTRYASTIYITSLKVCSNNVIVNVIFPM